MPFLRRPTVALVVPLLAVCLVTATAPGVASGAPTPTVGTLAPTPGTVAPGGAPQAGARGTQASPTTGAQSTTTSRPPSTTTTTSTTLACPPGVVIPPSPPTTVTPTGPSTTGGKTTTTSTTTTTLAPCPTTTTTVPLGTEPATLPPNAQAVSPDDPEVPQDEAELLALIDNVHSRLAELKSSISTLDNEIGSNQATLLADTKVLFSRQAVVAAANQKIETLAGQEIVARDAMRSRAVAAYIHQPTDDLATMLLHLSDPSQLVDARNFYETVVDVQEKDIKRLDSLGKQAREAAKQAVLASDAAKKQQQTVVAQGQALQSLKQALETVQQESTSQQGEETKLLAEVGLQRAEFAAEVAAEAAQSANIEELLASISVPGATATVPVGAGFFAFPLPGAPITSPFGPRIDPIAGYEGFHPGVDFGAPLGTPIHAAGDGIVVFAGQESGYGNYTCINHGQNIATCYGHQSAILVKVGQQVKRGQIIGLVGSTGYSTGPHLHFEVRIDGQVTDPMPWLIGVPPGTSTTTTTARPSNSPPPSSSSS